MPVSKIIFLFIHMSMNQIAKVDCNAFLSESYSRNLSLLYHFARDSTLLPQIPNSGINQSRDLDKDCDQFT